jgi:hypothetical protein
MQPTYLHTENEEDIFMDINDFEIEGNGEEVDLEGAPTWHDSKDNNYDSLESFLGVLDEGCSFGELAMQPKTI